MLRLNSGVQDQERERPRDQDISNITSPNPMVEVTNMCGDGRAITESFTPRIRKTGTARRRQCTRGFMSVVEAETPALVTLEAIAVSVRRRSRHLVSRFGGTTRANTEGELKVNRFWNVLVDEVRSKTRAMRELAMVRMVTQPFFFGRPERLVNLLPQQ